MRNYGAVAKYQKGSCLFIAQYSKAAWLPHGHHPVCRLQHRPPICSESCCSVVLIYAGNWVGVTEKTKLPTLVSAEPLKRPPLGFQWTPQKSAKFYDPFKPQEPIELRQKLYTNRLNSSDVGNFALGFLVGSGQKCFRTSLFNGVLDLSCQKIWVNSCLPNYASHHWGISDWPLKLKEIIPSYIY